MNPLPGIKEKEYLRAHYTDRPGLYLLQLRLKEYLKAAAGRPVVLLCIGTDRSTGDSLGPLTGTKLDGKGLSGLTVIGTLEKPVHAENLDSTLKNLFAKYYNPYIIALDACLGQLDSVGYISLAEGPLKPGAAVKKELPEVGEIHLTGIVNINGFMQYMVLQNTRLSIVWQMSEVLCNLFQRTYFLLNQS
ncbi:MULTISPECIES: spore protease YyaC [unclassified Dehalobacter]|uniref:spore protease YyaC n=1 Tax=unclassified Dehalobacter TaxID=2635733 RepID=UPI000E6D0984|nr:MULTISPECIES: spore protease YyaC [unclassified Dehalobacter]RJE47365.1 spore protease YyaC [Dehalobacter sp. MCB1]TCX48826.1 spore protease YyaC [Dehalobacter sp. 14DCB1]TCX56126.1 spore protease YyaC [Dehalobacter sp. 12DCB1]